MCIGYRLVSTSSPNDHPDKIVFNLKDGGVSAYNLHSNYVVNERELIIKDRVAVPFRLTQNITHFLTPFYEGAFELAVGAIALVGTSRRVDV